MKLEEDLVCFIRLPNKCLFCENNENNSLFFLIETHRKYDIIISINSKVNNKDMV